LSFFPLISITFLPPQFRRLQFISIILYLWIQFYAPRNLTVCPALYSSVIFFFFLNSSFVSFFYPLFNCLSSPSFENIRFGCDLVFVPTPSSVPLVLAAAIRRVPSFFIFPKLCVSLGICSPVSASFFPPPFFPCPQFPLVSGIPHVFMGIFNLFQFLIFPFSFSRGDSFPIPTPPTLALLFLQSPTRVWPLSHKVFFPLKGRFAPVPPYLIPLNNLFFFLRTSSFPSDAFFRRSQRIRVTF